MSMPQNLDFPLYFNILFFSVIGIGFIIGYFRGLKKTLYSLIVISIFYAFFFITIDTVINSLWTAPIGFAMSYLTPYVSGIGSANNLGEALVIALDTFAGDTLGPAATNEQLLLFATGLAQFVLKLVYTILYFTVGLLVYRILTWIIRILFFTGAEKKYDKQMKKFKKGSKRSKKAARRSKRGKESRGFDYDGVEKPKKLKKYPLLGGVAGAAKGAVSAFVTLIIFGGMLNIMDSMLQVIPEDQPVVSREQVELIYLANSPTIDPVTPRMMATPFDIPDDYDEQLDMARDMIDAFNTNIFVSNASAITYTTEDYNNEQIPLHLYLFDSVLSFNYGETRIMFRNELDVISDTAAVLMESEFVETNNISDITATEITTLFTTLSNSDLIASLIPLGIEVGSEMNDIPIDIPVEDLYEIDWQAELENIGAIAASGFTIINNAGILNEETDLQTVTLDGTEVQALFDDLAASELITTAAAVGIDILLEGAGEQMQALITVPDDLDWAAEIAAFGEVAKAVLDTEITMADLESGDPTILINTLSGLDLTVLLESKLVTNALINVFNGNAGIEGLDMITIPDGITWILYDDDGNVIGGELQNILLAINAITDVADGFDFENITLQVIADFDNATIDALFDSQVLVATISTFLLDMDLGGEDMPLLIPDTALDLNGYITSTEMKAVANSVRILINDLACTPGDTECEEIGFDVTKAFSLSETAIDTVTSSNILAATLGNLILTQGGDIVTVPASTLVSISVDSVPQDVVGVPEIKAMFGAVSTLGFSDLENMTFDASIIGDLAEDLDPDTLDTDKTDKLFASKIIHATLSTMLFDLTEGDESVLSVPYFAEDGTTEIREYNAVDDLEYLSTNELEHILQALITIDITDFNEVDSLDIGLILENSTVLLDSAILHATISKQVLDLGTETIAVPYQDIDGNDIRIEVGDALAGTDTLYLARTEIEAMLDALEVLDITDINTFDGNVDIASIVAPPENPGDPSNISILLASATIHATVSDQLLSLSTDGTLSVPYKAEDGSDVRVLVGPVGNETEFITKDEITNMIDVLNILGITEDIDSFDGNVDVASIMADPANVDELLESATIQATISKQMFDLETGGTLAVPIQAANTDAIRVTVGTAPNDTEYITADEIRAIFDALEVLGITDDINSFDGNVDIASITSDPANIDTLLASATIHATISKQLIDLETGGTLSVPHLEDDDVTQVRLTISGTEYVSSAEVRALVDALVVLGITDDINTFDGNVDIASIVAPADPGEDSNITILLRSSTIQATITTQMLDLADAGTLVVPYYKENTDPVLVTVGDAGASTDTQYLSVEEIEALVEALDVLGLTEDIDTFDGNVDIASVMADPANIGIILESATIQATISKQMIDLDDVSGTLQVPYLEENDTQPIRITVGTGAEETVYIWSDEIEALFTALDTLGITSDIDTFDGNVDLSVLDVDGSPGTPDAAKIANVVASSIIQATISEQIIDIETSATVAFVVPYMAEDDLQEVRFTVGTIGQPDETNYVWSTEIENIIKGMRILNIADVTTFDGDIDLSSFLTAGSDRDTLLSSNIMKATISKQLIDLDEEDDILVVPDNDVDLTSIRVETGGLGTENEYVSETEIRAVFDALNLLGLSNVNDFDINFSLSLFAAPEDQTTLLASAIMHKTITDKMTGLGETILIVPEFEQDGSTDVRTLAGSVEFVVKQEVKDVINALLAMGIGDLNITASISSTSFFNDPGTVLESASIQATLSNKMLTGTNGALIVPDDEYVSGDPIRIELASAAYTTVTYIDIDELNAIIDGLVELGLDDVDFTTFGGSTFGAGTVLGANFGDVLESESLQATISDTILDGASLETAPSGTASLIVPAYYRQDITVDGDALTYDQIEATELENMLNAMDVLSLGDFGSSLDSSVITNLTGTDLDTLLLSKSIHSTIDSMFRGGSNAGNIPALAESTAFEFPFIETITYDWELKAFILATQQVMSPGDTFTNITFDLTLLASKTTAQRTIIVDSYTVRNILTPLVEGVEALALVTPDPSDEYGIAATDYMNDNASLFFKKDNLIDILEHFYPAP
jgi:hypothetical protein